MTVREADFLPAKINQFVPSMKYHASVVHSGPFEIDLGTPVAADADGILDDESIATAGSTTTFESAYSNDNMSKYGRNVTVVASGAATSDVTVRGRDYLGQPMMETLTLNGTTAVNGVKAFKFIEEVEFEATAGTTIDLGWGDALGLPFATRALIKEMQDGVAATAGTFVARSTATQSATSADPRGTYTPNSVANGSREYTLLAHLDRERLHGVAHHYA